MKQEYGCADKHTSANYARITVLYARTSYSTMDLYVQDTKLTNGCSSCQNYPKGEKLVSIENLDLIDTMKVCKLWFGNGEY
jgi:hypothetical protein